MRTALVTGSTSGIGLAIAAHLAHLNYSVILNGFGDAQLAIRSVQQATPGAKVGFVDADLMRASECTRMIDEAEKMFGRLDVLVNNAGMQHVCPIESFPTEQWDRIMALNLNAVFHCTKAALPFMKRQKFGRIINIASVHGLVGSANKCAYVAAKHGVIGFTKVAALELASEDITVNSICPGWVLTPLVEKQIEAKSTEMGVSLEKAMELLVCEKMPSKTPATVEELALAVSFFADSRNKSTRGVALNIDGGWVAQ